MMQSAPLLSIIYDTTNTLHIFINPHTKAPREQKGEANQKQQLSDYIYIYMQVIMTECFRIS